MAELIYKLGKMTFVNMTSASSLPQTSKLEFSGLWSGIAITITFDWLMSQKILAIVDAGFSVTFSL